MHKEKTAKVNENSAMINTEGFEHTSQTQVNLQTLSNMKSSNSQAEIKKNQEEVTSKTKTIANSRSYKEVQSQKMLPTAIKAKRISEITDNHMATQELLIPSEKSLHVGELNIE